MPLLARDKTDKGKDYEAEDESLSPYFEDQGFQSMYALRNLGSTIFYMMI